MIFGAEDETRRADAIPLQGATSQARGALGKKLELIAGGRWKKGLEASATGCLFEFFARRTLFGFIQHRTLALNTLAFSVFPHLMSVVEGC
jgi:hypothetical protein